MRHITPKSLLQMPATYSCSFGIIALPSSTEWSAAIVAALIVALAVGAFQLVKERRKRSAPPGDSAPSPPKPRRRLSVRFAYERIDGDPPGGSDADLDQTEGRRARIRPIDDGAPTEVTRSKK